MAGLVKEMTFLKEDERGERLAAREKPQHFGDGIVQGGQVFYTTMKTGVVGLVDRPREGASREGLTGFLKGVGKGLVGVVAAPVVGTLGAFSRVTEGVDATVRGHSSRQCSYA